MNQVSPDSRFCAPGWGGAGGAAQWYSACLALTPEFGPQREGFDRNGREVENESGWYVLYTCMNVNSLI